MWNGECEAPAGKKQTYDCWFEGRYWREGHLVCGHHARQYDRRGFLRWKSWKSWKALEQR